jgi:pyroglutamyl-peptidase
MRDSILVAGFEPFEGRRKNRSWEVVRRIPPRAGLDRVQLPVDHQRLIALMPTLVARAPRAVLLLGESPRRSLSVEQLALNVRDCDRADNSGAKPTVETILAQGPLALRATWDARAVAHRLNEGGVPAVASFHAGAFACNAALYLALQFRAQQTAVGFLHVPHRRWPLGVRLSALVQAAETCIEALLANARKEQK